jgi:hypothetical protein
MMIRFALLVLCAFLSSSCSRAPAKPPADGPPSTELTIVGAPSTLAFDVCVWPTGERVEIAARADGFTTACASEMLVRVKSEGSAIFTYLVQGVGPQDVRYHGRTRRMTLPLPEVGRMDLDLRGAGPEHEGLTVVVMPRALHDINHLDRASIERCLAADRALADFWDGVPIESDVLRNDVLTLIGSMPGGAATAELTDGELSIPTHSWLSTVAVVRQFDGRVVPLQDTLALSIAHGTSRLFDADGALLAYYSPYVMMPDHHASRTVSVACAREPFVRILSDLPTLFGSFAVVESSGADSRPRSGPPAHRHGVFVLDDLEEGPVTICGEFSVSRGITVVERVVDVTEGARIDLRSPLVSNGRPRIVFECSGASESQIDSCFESERAPFVLALRRTEPIDGWTIEYFGLPRARSMEFWSLPAGTYEARLLSDGHPGVKRIDAFAGPLFFHGAKDVQFEIGEDEGDVTIPVELAPFAPITPDQLGFLPPSGMGQPRVHELVGSAVALASPHERHALVATWDDVRRQWIVDASELALADGRYEFVVGSGDERAPIAAGGVFDVDAGTIARRQFGVTGAGAAVFEVVGEPTSEPRTLVLELPSGDVLEHALVSTVEGARHRLPLLPLGSTVRLADFATEPARLRIDGAPDAGRLVVAD